MHSSESPANTERAPQVSGTSLYKRLAELHRDPVFRAKRRRNLVASNLALAVALSGSARSRIAAKAGIKPAQLSRQLSGSVNLTLDSIGRICEAVGCDFDVVFRKAAASETRQAWLHSGVNRTTLASLWRKGDAQHSLPFSQRTYSMPESGFENPLPAPAANDEEQLSGRALLAA